MPVLHPDAITVKGPSPTDGGWTITMKLGEYEREEALDLMKIPVDQIESVEFNEKTERTLPSTIWDKE